MLTLQRVFFLGILSFSLTQASLFDGSDPDPTAKSHKGKNRKPREAVQEALKKDYEARMRERQHANTQKQYAEDLTQKEMDSIVHDKNIKESQTALDDKSKSNEELTALWEKHMHDFVPEDFVTFEIPEGQSVMFLERIAHDEPTRVRGAYYVVGGTKETRISHTVLDENMDVVFNHHDDIQGISLFNTSISGDAEYAFLFTNESPGGRVVTFGLHTQEEFKPYDVELWDMDDDGNLFKRVDPEQDDAYWKDSDDVKQKDKDQSDAADSEDIGSVKKMLKSLTNELRQMLHETKNSLNRQNGHNDDLLNSYSWQFYMMMIEVIIFVGIIMFQLYHTKKSLDNKLIL